MKRERISETIGNIDLKYIDEADGYGGRAKAPRGSARHKWAAAACLALVLAAGIPIAGGLFATQDGPSVPTLVLVEYEGAYLEVLEDAADAERFGLEREITEDMLGKRLAFLRRDGGLYTAAAGETDAELLEYSPAPYRAVSIVRDGGAYRYALFCNYLVGTDEALPIQDAFAVYGIDEASDIVSITPVKDKSGGSWKPAGAAITDGAAISDLFRELSRLDAVCFDDYHSLVYADELDRLEGTGGDIESEAYARVADDGRDIVMTTGDGLRFGIRYYPSYGWIWVSETMSYYRMPPGLSGWFSRYVK